MSDLEHADRPERPRDLIDDVEAVCAEKGHFVAIDEEYYRAFLGLSERQMENLMVAVMFDQEKEVCRLANGSTSGGAVERVSKLVYNCIHLISIGLMRFDAFGHLGLYARIGLEPDEDMDEALAARMKEMEPVIRTTVRRTLPWLLSCEGRQGELPL